MNEPIEAPRGTVSPSPVCAGGPPPSAANAPIDAPALFGARHRTLPAALFRPLAGPRFRADAGAARARRLHLAAVGRSAVAGHRPRAGAGRPRPRRHLLPPLGRRAAQSADRARPGRRCCPGRAGSGVDGGSRAHAARPAHRTRRPRHRARASRGDHGRQRSSLPCTHDGHPMSLRLSILDQSVACAGRGEDDAIRDTTH